MTDKEKYSINTDIYNPDNYRINTLNDEITADNNCKLLIKQYHQHLLKNKEFSQFEAGSMASGADYYLRDFMIDHQRSNIFIISPDQVRCFAGNWYIVSTLEPNMVELESILSGISGFYNFCASENVLDLPTATEIERACSDLDYYRQRIETFHELMGDDFKMWNNACPLTLNTPS